MSSCSSGCWVEALLAVGGSPYIVIDATHAVKPASALHLPLLAAARKLTASREILLWMTPSEAPKALQASECSELLDPMRASDWISAQR